MTLNFTEYTNASLTRKADRGGQSRVSVEFGDGFQSDLVELGWNDRQAGALDDQLLARMPKGSSIDWEDRELMHLSFPAGSSQNPVQDVAALLSHVRDNPVDQNAVDQKLRPDTPAPLGTRKVEVPADFKSRYPGAQVSVDSEGRLCLSGAGRAGREEVLDLFRQLGHHALNAPAAPVVKPFPEDGFVFGQASAQAAASATAAAAGPLGGMVFVFTGALDGMSRSDASKRVAALGAKTAGDVTKKTTHVVVGENPGDKLAKANELGLTVLDQQQFEMLLAK